MRSEQARLLATQWDQRTAIGSEAGHGLYDQMVDFLSTVVPDTEFAAVVPRTAPQATHHQALYSHEILALGEGALLRIQGDGNPAPEPGHSEYTINASTVPLSAFSRVQVIDERLPDRAAVRRTWCYYSPGSGYPVIKIALDGNASSVFTGQEADLAVELARRLAWR